MVIIYNRAASFVTVNLLSVVTIKSIFRCYTLRRNCVMRTSFCFCFSGDQVIPIKIYDISNVTQESFPSLNSENLTSLVLHTTYTHRVGSAIPTLAIPIPEFPKLY
jgi:hypothetical protein